MDEKIKIEGCIIGVFRHKNYFLFSQRMPLNIWSAYAGFPIQLLNQMRIQHSRKVILILMNLSHSL